jgi:putative transposase
MIPARARYSGYRFPGEIISHAVWLYFRFPLGLRMVEELLAARGIIVSHETVRQWARKFGQPFANRIRRRLPRIGDKWHLDEVVLKIAGMKHWLWRAVDQTGIVLDVLVQRRDKQAGQAVVAQTAEEADAAAARHNHRQACQLRRGKAGGHAGRRGIASTSD